MKKIFSLVAGLVLIIALSACSASTSSNAGPKNANDLLEKAQKASQNIKSFKANTATDLAVSEKGQKVSTTSKGTINFQKEPLVMYSNQKATDKGQPVNMELYMTKDKIYLKDPTGKQWVKLDNPQSKELQNLTNSQSTDLKGQLKNLKGYSKDFNLEEKDNAYVLKFNGKGKDFQKFVNKMMDKQLANVDEQTKQALKNVKYNSASFTYSFDKKKFTPKTMNMKMDMTVTNPDDTSDKAKMKMNMRADYSQFNKVKVSVPSDVKNNAKDLKTPDLNGDNSSLNKDNSGLNNDKTDFKTSSGTYQ
ncbi:DUF6612 family protein [Scopulibacillus cellulosilyticus]|uniref:DUF6612 family protein n=1 Tax=Scopulibacillus cellulosilyticus TaxID=2665665 RepID=A0ABW2PZE9_9BACL